MAHHIVQLPQVQCPHSRGKTCTLMSNKVGFHLGVAKTLCEKCLSGGVDSPTSVALREDAVDRVLATIRDNPEVAMKVKSFAGWQRTQLSWRAAVNWGKSKASRVLGSVPLKVLEVRRQSCFGKNASGACPMMKKHTDGFHYCGACGCGVREDTRLDGDPSKLEFPYLQCPLGRPGFSNEAVPDRLLREIPSGPNADPRNPVRSLPLPEQVGQETQPQLPPPTG